MLAPPNKLSARPTRKELQEEADRRLAQYKERPEDYVYRHHLDVIGNPVFPIVARHVEMVGANLWNGVGSEKNVPRPCREWHWTSALKTYHPAHDLHASESEPPKPAVLKWATPKLMEIFKPPLIEQHADEPPLPARSLRWTTPTLVEVGAEDELAARLADGFRDGALPLDAFRYLARWRRFLPGPSATTAASSARAPFAVSASQMKRESSSWPTWIATQQLIHTHER
jgi:hypothetical protein